MTPSVCFFTVCGGGEDYEFLLGQIGHHAKRGKHVVLDTTPPSLRRTFKNLPPSALWIHEPFFGHGWKNFDNRSAMERAAEIASWQGSDVVAQVDCDEFYVGNCELLFETAKHYMVTVDTHHWKRDGHAYTFGGSEIHRRLWPASMSVEFRRDQGWIKSDKFDGNPNRHPIPTPPFGAGQIRHVEGARHHHVHYALGKKSLDETTAKSTIQGWPDGDRVEIHGSWPPLLARWRDEGVLPSTDFS